MRRTTPLLTTLFACLALAACGGGGGAPAPASGQTADNSGGDVANAGGFCVQQIGNGGGSWVATFDASCVNCATANAGNAIDNDGDTSATVTMDSTGTGAYSLTAEAQSGVVFPAGSTPAIKWEHFRTGPTNVQIDFVTYLDGVEQQREEPVILAGAVGAMTGYGGTAQITATDPFDAIELAVVFGSGAMESIDVFEFCGDFGV